MLGSHPVSGSFDTLLPPALHRHRLVAAPHHCRSLPQSRSSSRCRRSPSWSEQRHRLETSSGSGASSSGTCKRLSLAYHDLRGTTDTTYRIQWDAPRPAAHRGRRPRPADHGRHDRTGMIGDVRNRRELALVALTVTPMLIGLLRFYGTRLRRQWHEAKTLESSAFSVVHEALGALRVVKAFGREDAERDRFAARSGGERPCPDPAIADGGKAHQPGRDHDGSRNEPRSSTWGCAASRAARSPWVSCSS